MTAFQITGYDKRTDLLAVQHALPMDRASDIRALAKMGPDDDGFGSYPIDAAATCQIGSWLDRPLPVDLYDWFVEPKSD